MGGVAVTHEHTFHATRPRQGAGYYLFGIGRASETTGSLERTRSKPKADDHRASNIKGHLFLRVVFVVYK